MSSSTLAQSNSPTSSTLLIKKVSNDGSQDSGFAELEMDDDSSGSDQDVVDAGGSIPVSRPSTFHCLIATVIRAPCKTLLYAETDLFLRFAMHRFFTYNRRPWKMSISRETFSASGFFMTTNHTLQCFYCRLELFHWDNLSTDVTAVHREFSSHCAFVKGEDVNDVPIGANVSDYRFEAHRLFSFLKRDWTAPVEARDLAKFGFYWTGESDKCVCVFCKLQISDWTEGDRAESEHRRWNPICPFINKHFVANVRIGEETQDQSEDYDVVSVPIPKDRTIMNPFSASEMKVCKQLKFGAGTINKEHEDIGVMPRSNPLHPTYNSREARLKSFDNWPKSLPQRPEELVDAGFFYTGHGDRVLCFHCGGGLKDWNESDIPWIEHIKWFSRCPYVHLHKTKSFVFNVLKEQGEITLPVEKCLEAVKNNIAQDQNESRAKSIAQNYVHTSANLEKYSKPVEKCGVLGCWGCQEKSIDTVTLPCGHMTLCQGCADSHPTSCMQCRQSGAAYIKVFMQ